MVTFVAFIAALALAEAAWRSRAIKPRRRLLLALAVAALAVALVAMPRGAMLGKLIGALAMPAGLLWLFLGGSFALQVHRRSRLGAGLALVGFVGFTIAGNGYLGAAWLARLEAPYAATDPLALASEDGAFDAVFVLGGGTRGAADARPQLSGAGDRVLLGGRLYHAGATPILVASGHTVPGAARQESAAAHTATLWQQIGVPPEAIVTLETPYNTRTEIAAYAELAEERGWERVGLVTSAWHLPRTMALAESAGLDVVPLPADFRGVPVWDGLNSLVPHAVGFLWMHRAAWETLGAATGR